MHRNSYGTGCRRTRRCRARRLPDRAGAPSATDTGEIAPGSGPAVPIQRPERPRSCVGKGVMNGTDRITTGKRGESCACRELRRRGYAIVATRYRTTDWRARHRRARPWHAGVRGGEGSPGRALRPARRGRHLAEAGEALRDGRRLPAPAPAGGGAVPVRRGRRQVGHRQAAATSKSLSTPSTPRGDAAADGPPRRRSAILTPRGIFGLASGLDRREVPGS